MMFAMVGDQQASLVGQGGIVAGAAKATFGTGGMLDVYAGTATPKHLARTARGTFPIVVYSEGNTLHWGSEAIMLTAGSNVEWLVNDMGLIPDAKSSEAVASSVASSDGVVYVPALIGMGTPQWDYARAELCSVSRAARRRPMWCVRCWRASHIAAPTCSRRAKPTLACASSGCASMGA